MREVGRVNARIHPAADAVCDPESYGSRVVDAADEEGVVARVWAGGAPPVTGRLDSVVWVEVEDVGGWVVRSVFADEGGGDVV